MNNFHFPANYVPPSNKSSKLIEELNQIDREIEEKKRAIQNQKKLEDEFYEDSKKNNIADEIMRELQAQKKRQGNPVQPVFRQQSKDIPVRRQNNFVNRRQLEKMKLQNQNGEQEYPFGSQSREKNKNYGKVMNSPPSKLIPEKDNLPQGRQVLKKQIHVLSIENAVNPFIKNEQIIKEKREQQERNYRRVLEQQREEERRRKKQIQQKHKKQQKEIFNNYVPPSSAEVMDVGLSKGVEIEVSKAKKRRDPNGEHPLQHIQKQYQISNFDLNYMKNQMEDLKNKLKRGRIDREQFDQRKKKLESYYNHVIEDEYEQPIKNQPSQERERFFDEHEQNASSFRHDNLNEESQNHPMQNKQQVNQLHLPSSLNPNIEHNKNLSQNFHNQHPSSNYQNNSHGAISPQAQMEMMMKLMQYCEGIIKIQQQSQLSTLNDKKFLQQTLSKMVPYFVPGSVNHSNIGLMTQQVSLSQNLNKRQFFTDKKVEKFDDFPKHSEGLPYPGESQISSSYIEKSLSGIAKKIPLTMKQKEEENAQSQKKEVEKFYSRKYTVKKFKPFEYIEPEDTSLSRNNIPSCSNYLQTKFAQDELNDLFDRDLQNYKKLQKERQMEILRKKINNDKSSKLQAGVNKEVPEQRKADSHSLKSGNKNNDARQYHYQKQQQPTTNPFLKKHISNESSQPPTFKEKDFKNFEIIQSPPHSLEVLEQQQYQTEPRKSESPTSITKLKNPNVKGQGQKRQNPSAKILNIMKTNNQLLSKYELTPSRNSNTHSISSIKESVRVESSKEYESKQYFSGHDISPVQRREYQSSLETVRSEEQSAREDRKNNMQILMMGSANQSPSLISQYQSPTVRPDSSIQGSSPKKKSYLNIESIQNDTEPIMVGYSQTVESIEESSSKFPSFQRPPNKKAGRSTSRKKESVVKIGGSSSSQSSLSGIPSEGSKQKSSMLKPPSYYDEKITKMESPRFDSNIYSSHFQQSMKSKSELQVQNRKLNEVQQKQFSSQNNQNSGLSLPESSREKFSNQAVAIGEKQVGNFAPKWKSLQQARKLARQFRQKSGEEANRSSVQEKLSELESFIHLKKQQNSINSKGNKLQNSNAKETKKKSILKMLDDLGDDEYNQDFDSYKEESEM